MRDKLAEAKSWLTSPSRLDKTEMIQALEGVSDDVLVRAYERWWGVYSEGIRTAPSNRKIEGIQQGVREKDATAASEAATEAVLALLRGELMTEADRLDKMYWKLAKEDFEARTRDIPDAPTWEKLTDGQRNSLRWLAQRRHERWGLKERTFFARYGRNPLARAAGENALLAFDAETVETQPESGGTFTLVGFDLDATDERVAIAREAVQKWREAYPELMRLLNGRVMTSDDVRTAPISMQDRLNGLGYNRPPGWDDGAHDAYREDD